MSVSRLRYVSAKVIGNEKIVEVVNALHAASDVATAKEIATATGIDHSLVRDVLVKLSDASIIRRLPRPNARATQYYEAERDSPVWRALCTTTSAITDLATGATSTSGAHESGADRSVEVPAHYAGSTDATNKEAQGKR